MKKGGLCFKLDQGYVDKGAYGSSSETNTELS